MAMGAQLTDLDRLVHALFQPRIKICDERPVVEEQRRIGMHGHG